VRGDGGLMTNVPSTGAGRTDFGPFFADMFAITGSIRYVAVGRGQDIAMQQRVGVDVASSDVGNRFEELLVNPTLLTLATQRDDLDRGGLRHLIIGYGYFNAYVLPIPADTCASPSRSIRTPWRAATPFDRPSSASGVGRPYGAGDALSCRWDGWHT
jgi:hypothetical protein